VGLRAVGIATRYGLDGPGIESGGVGGARFSAPVQTGPGAHPHQSLPGVKWPGRGLNYLPPSRAEVKERVQLYIYSTSGPSWPVTGRTLPLPLPLIRGTFIIHRVQFVLRCISTLITILVQLSMVVLFLRARVLIILTEPSLDFCFVLYAVAVNLCCSNSLPLNGPFPHNDY